MPQSTDDDVAREMVLLEVSNHFKQQYGRKPTSEELEPLLRAAASGNFPDVNAVVEDLLHRFSVDEGVCQRQAC